MGGGRNYWLTINPNIKIILGAADLHVRTDIHRRQHFL